MQKGATIVLKWAAASVIGIAIILGISYVALHPAEAGRELAMATTQQPEPYTELYFDNPEELPGTIPTETTALPVVFILRSHEPQATEFIYRVSFKDAQNTTALPDGKLILQPGESKSIAQTITVPAGRTRGEVSVQIVNKSQSLRFWLERL